MGYVVNRGTKDRPVWYGKFKDKDHAWKQKKTGQLTKAAALRVVAEWEARVARGLVGIPEVQDAIARMTVGALVERFEQTYTRPKIKDIEAYRARVRTDARCRIFPYAISHLSAAEVRRADIIRWRDELAQKYAGPSVNRSIDLLSTVYGWALTQELLDGRNPCSKIERMPSPPSEDHYSLAEVQRLLDPRCRIPMVTTALYTGMRKGELYGLTWPCVQLEGNLPRIDVNRSYLGLPKSGKPRSVPIHSELLLELQAWRARCPTTPEQWVFPRRAMTMSGRWTGAYIMGQGRDMACLVPQDYPLLWPGEEERSEIDVQDLLHLLGCHVAEDPWHAMRHTFSTHFLEASGNGDALSKILGHSQGGGIAAITRRYTHTGLAYLLRELTKMTLLPVLPERVSHGLASRTDRKETP